MTILSNYRLHSYKASASCHTRDITPKKRTLTQPSHKIQLKSRYTRSITPPKKYLKLQTSEAIPVISIMKEEERIITVWGEEYRIQLPPGYDMYEGLRRWYPSLYEAVIDEERLQKIESEATDEDPSIELAWDHHDYLEWLFD